MNDLMQENGKGVDVPFYSLDSILSATDDFSEANKLGQGGFGPVYKVTTKSITLSCDFTNVL